MYYYKQNQIFKMWLCVEKTDSLEGVVEAPPSKSYTHRALIVSMLAKKSRIRNPLISSDTMATKNACESLGAEILEKNGDWIVNGVDGIIDVKRDVIDVKNSGTTLRFIASLAALSKKEVEITGDKSIRQRPISELLNGLKDLAYIKDTNGFAPIRIRNKGDIEDVSIKIRGDISSQFISSLLLIAPMMGLEIIITTPLKSKPYVDITIDVMKKAGIDIKKTDNGFYVKKQKYKNIDYKIPGDFSSAANILCPCSFIESNVEIKNLSMDDKQGDKRVIDILRDIGAILKIKKNSVKIMNGENLNAMNIDASDIPDLVPPLVSVFCFSNGTSLIKNIEHLKYKECNRLNACKEFRKLGVDIEIGDDKILIKGPNRIKSATLRAFNDHRMVMALASAAMKAESGVTRIDSADMLNVSFPKYLEDMQRLGARMWIENG